MTRAGEVAFLAVLAAFLAGFCLLGRFHYGYSAGLMLFPALVAGASLAVIGLQLAILARARSDGAAARALPPKPPAPALIRLLWLVAILPFVALLGYPAGLALYLLCALRQAGEGWTVALAVAAGSLAVTLGLFVALLGVPLPVHPFWWPR